MDTSPPVLPDVISIDEAIMDENTPLIQTGATLSYIETAPYLDLQDDLSDDSHSRSQGKSGSSINSDYQSSVFLPSFQCSGSSTATSKQSRRFVDRSLAQSSTHRPLYGSRSVMVASLVEKESADRGASFLLATGNVLPFLMSSAVFSMPFTIAAGGYASIAAMILLSVLADLTGIILADCLYEISPRSRLRKRICMDYVEIADATWGKHGSRLIYFVQVFFLYSADIVNLVLLGASFYGVLKAGLRHDISLSPTVISAIVSTVVIPSLFIQRLSYLGYLSLLSIASVVIGMVAVLVVFIQHYAKWRINAFSIPAFNQEGFTLGLSMMFYAIIVHPVLPQIEGSMQHRNKYKSVLHVSFALSSMVKIIIGVLGALTFGPATNTLVSLNVSKLNRPAGIVSNLALSLYAIFVFPLDLFVVCEAFDLITLKQNSKFKKGEKYHNIWILLTRPFLVGIGLGIAVVVPYFGLLIGVLGSLLGTLLVFIFPILFHVQLKWKSLSRHQIVSEIVLMLIGTAIGIVGLYASVEGLILAVSGKSVV